MRLSNPFLALFALLVLVEEATLGSGELEIGEITFPATGRPGGQHGHTSTEIFYILSGTLRHTVNGASHDLTPGMVGFGFKERPVDQ